MSLLKSPLAPLLLAALLMSALLALFLMSTRYVIHPAPTMRGGAGSYLMHDTWSNRVSLCQVVRDGGTLCIPER